MRLIAAAIAMIVLGAAAAAAVGGAGGIAAAPPGPPQVRVPELTARLGALSPDKPAEYFLLGEEVASEADTPDAVDLARTLFVLAYETDTALEDGTRRTPRMGASVCFALASLAENDERRRWLGALAASLDDRGDAQDADAAALDGAGGEAGFELATALGLVRAADGRQAIRLLDKPEVGALLERYDRLLDPAGLTGGAARIRQLAQSWPVCPECRNRRIVTRPGAGQPVTMLCATCGGNPGPRLTDAELGAQLRLEALALDGSFRSWGAQELSDRGAPLRDPNPAELAPTYRVDPTKTVWRDGAWTAP